MSTILKFKKNGQGDVSATDNGTALTNNIDEGPQGKKQKKVKYPGIRSAMDGNSAVIMCEREASDAAGAYPITPSTQMGEYFAEAAAQGHINVSDRSLIFIEPEGEHAAAGVTAGLSMTGLRATNFSSGQGVAYMHESLYAAAGKRLTYVLNMGCRAITKATLNVHAGHDDYHAIDDTGFFQVMGKSAQEVCDLNLIAHKIAELSLTPGICAQDGFLTTHLIESLLIPERELIAEFLGRPDDIIDTPTPAQRMLYGDKRRRIPTLWDVDDPMVSGAVQNQDAYMQSVAAQRPYFYQHVAPLTDQVMEEFYQLTGRRYNRINSYRSDDADYLIVGHGSMLATAEAVADYMRKTRKIKVGVVNIHMFRPFPGDLLGHVLKGRKGVVVLERVDQPLAEDLPLMREVRSCVSKCIENGVAKSYDHYAAFTAKDIPPLYSGSFGLGSRDLQPEGLIGAIENMLPDGKKRKFFYLSVDFVHDHAATPKQEIYQQNLLDHYPRIKELSLHGSENPNLMPEGCIAIRMHSVGGWGMVTTGKNLAMTLFELLGYHIKANPKYGSEKKGQPTTYYLSAAPEPIRVNSEYHHVDAVLSPDPNVFDHANPVAGLAKGGLFVIQSDLDSPEAVWRHIPEAQRRYIVENDIKVYYIDAFKIARAEATDADLQFRMQGIAFQGAFFAASDICQRVGLDEKSLFNAIHEQLEHKFGAKGKHIVEDNVRVVRRGFDEVKEIKHKSLDIVHEAPMKQELNLPMMIKQQPVSDDQRSDLHRFWEQTAGFYSSGQGSDNLVDPFIGLSVMPAATGLYRDMTLVRFDYPKWIPENCTACGDCYVVCPDSAIPGLVNSVPEVFNTVINHIETHGIPTRHLRRAVRTVEKKLRALIDSEGDHANVRALLQQAIDATIKKSEKEDERAQLSKEFDKFNHTLGDFQFAVTKPYYNVKEKKAKGSGGLFSLTVNPYTCKGCMECVAVCNDDALITEPQQEEDVTRMRSDWAFWQELPTTSHDYIRIDNIDEAVGALHSMLLDKGTYGSMVCGDGACIGCGEKTIVHLFTSTVSALLQPRVQRQVAKLDKLIADLEHHIKLKMMDGLDLSDLSAMREALNNDNKKDLTLSQVSAHMEEHHQHILDRAWLSRVTQLLEKLKHLRWHYVSGPTHKGRAHMGFINATGCTSVWGSTFPYNPYPFPWTSHLFQDSPSVAMGIFEGHMVKMAEGFKAIRMVELELAGKYDAKEHDLFFKRFDWKQFSDEEFLLCPPVVSVGGDGAMYDIGFQNLSRMLMSGRPIKVLILDTQVYSNTGGQACTSGFRGQVADMSPFGAEHHGKEERRKEMSLIGMAHRTSYVLQGGINNITHLLEGYIEGLNSREPAVFNIYAVCSTEHGVGDDAAWLQSKMAVESRAYPLFKFNPLKGVTLAECIDLSGNPEVDKDWPSYTLKYQTDDGREASMAIPLTFADFAVTEGRFRKHFKIAPRSAWNDDMIPLHEFIEMNAEQQKGRYPYIWTVDKEHHLGRVIVAEELVQSTVERRNFWRVLRALKGEEHKAVDVSGITNQVRQEMAQQLASTLLNMASGGGNAAALMQGLSSAPTATPSAPKAPSAKPAAAGDYEPAWIETPECTACDECTNLNANIFAYNDDKLAYIKNAQGGPYSDIVKAAEKCTASIIHPGTPWDMSEADIDKWIKRAEKYQ